MSHLVLEYNPFRGGFLLLLDPQARDKRLSVCEGLVGVFLSAEQKVLAVESAWGSSGLYLHDLQADRLRGRFEAEGPAHEIKGNGLFCLQQDPDLFSLWFPTPPNIAGGFLCQREGTTRTSLWFSSQWLPLGSPEDRPAAIKKSELLKKDKVRSVGGLQLKFSCVANAYPIQSIEFVVRGAK